MKKIILKATLCLMAFLLFLGSIFNIVIAIEQQDVVLSIFPRPKIDIILAKSRTKTDVSSFASELESALKEKDVDTSDVVIQSIEAQTITDVSSFNWVKRESSKIGSITIKEGGKDVDFVGNYSEPGKNVMYIMPTENQEQNFTFDYNIDFGDSFKAAGMLLRVKESGSNLTGYMLSFNKTGQDYYSLSNNNGALWEFTFDGNNLTNMTKTLVQGLNISTSGQLTVSATDMEIKISGSAISSPYTYTIPDDKTSITGNGYGFFSDHYSHGCDDFGQFSLKNINLQTAVVKKFNEVLRVPDWRTDSYKVLVYVEDTPNEELQSNSAMGELLTRLLNDDIYFVGWGTEKNEAQLQNLIKSNNDKGKFINNTGYTSSLSETAQYIKDLIDNMKSSDYLLVDEPISVNVTPPGIDENTIDDEWKFGKWKVTHDYQYFENDMGQFANSGKYTDAMIKSFDKTGRYVITYEDRAITPKEIFVHRRPVAEIDMKVDGTNVTLASKSYDLDKKSINNGIEHEEWKYKSMDETEWNSGQLTTIDESKSYIVQLRVQDYQGEWSAPATKYITKDANVLPIAMFNLGSQKISKYEALEVNDASYDPAGGSISTYEWELYKGKDKIDGPSPTPITDFNNRETGEYTLYLTVTNDRGKKSEKCGKTFTVTNDEISPEFIATPTSQETWKQNAKVNLVFTDRGGSGFRGYTYAITNDQGTPDSWLPEKDKATDDITITDEGRKYLHIRGYDNDSNVSNDRVLGPYLVDNSEPTAIISSDFSTIITNPLQVTITTTDTYSGVKKVTFNNNDLSNTNENIVTIDKNGTYPLIVEDIAGNIHTENINVTNIYRTCEAGLEHPIYSSDYDTCPICDLIQGLSVTNDEVTYDTHEKSVTYENPHHATIVEYYNGSTVKPKDVGDYNYELKIVYDEHEYQTGVTGTFSIKPQAVTIEGITATNRQYDSTTVVEIQGGTLVGINSTDIDDVNFILPTTGTIDNKDIGTYDVSISKIELTGEKANNYTLVQPQKQDVQVQIIPKDITIENIIGINRQYDGTTTVEIKGGNLIGIEEIDKEKVGFILPSTGTIENKDIGTYDVSIDEILLDGDEAKNYKLVQPLKDDVSVSIEKRQITITGVKGKDRKYNKTDVVEIEGGVLENVIEGDDVKAVIPKTGTATQKTVGQSEVIIEDIVLEGNDVKNYILIQPKKEDILVNITNPDVPKLRIESFVSAINGKKDEAEIRYDDEIQITIRIYNDGEGAGYAQKITDIIPEGLEFVKGNRINVENGWKQAKANTFETEILNSENIDNELSAQTKNNETYKDILLVLKVVDDTGKIPTAKNITQIEQVDILNEKIPFNNGENENVLDIKISYTDFSVENTIKQIIEIGNQGEINHPIPETSNKLAKVEIHRKKINSTRLKIVYQISITNKGNASGNIDRIECTIPDGMNIAKESSQEWKNVGNIITNDSFKAIPPNATEIKEVILEAVASQVIGTKSSSVLIVSGDDIDQIRIEKSGKNTNELQKTNNYNTLKIIVSVSTGIKKIILINVIVAIFITTFIVILFLKFKKR